MKKINIVIYGGSWLDIEYYILELFKVETAPNYASSFDGFRLTLKLEK